MFTLFLALYSTISSVSPEVKTNAQKRSTFHLIAHKVLDSQWKKRYFWMVPEPLVQQFKKKTLGLWGREWVYGKSQKWPRLYLSHVSSISQKNWVVCVSIKGHNYFAPFSSLYSFCFRENINAESHALSFAANAILSSGNYFQPEDQESGWYWLWRKMCIQLASDANNSCMVSVVWNQKWIHGFGYVLIFLLWGLQTISFI